MDNLPNELLVVILHYLENFELEVCYRSTQVLKILKQIVPIQVIIEGNFIKSYYARKIIISYYNKHKQLIPSIFSPNLKKLHYRWSNHEIELPPALTHLNLYGVKNTIISDLPKTLTHLTININNSLLLSNGLIYLKNLCICPDNLPISLKYLILDNYTQGVSLPPNLTHLKFGDNFNEIIELPNNLTHLLFGKTFNQTIDNLPNTLKFLVFGFEFNQSIDKLPLSITHLKFGAKFSQSITSLQNHKLTHFVCGANGNYDLKSLPKTITFFEYPSGLDKPPKNLFPNLTHIIFGTAFNRTVDNLMFGITNIKFGYNFDQKVDKLPSSLKHLTFGSYFNQSVDKLPQSLLYLKFSGQFSQTVGKLPANLIEIIFGSYFNQSVDKLPNVKKVTFSFGFKNLVTNLPHSIEYLVIFFVNGELNLPNLKFLKFNNKYLKIPCVIPKSVIHLKILRESIDVIPRHVKYVEFI